LTVGRSEKCLTTDAEHRREIRMGIGRLSFVAWLFVMAIACFIIGGTGSSLGWLVGGVVLLSVAVYAMRQFKKEAEAPREGVSIGFFGLAIVIMIVAMLGLFWLQFSA
jgi:hypothetical protein